MAVGGELRTFGGALAEGNMVKLRLVRAGMMRAYSAYSWSRRSFCAVGEMSVSTSRPSGLNKEWAAISMGTNGSSLIAMVVSLLFQK